MVEYFHWMGWNQNTQSVELFSGCEIWYFFFFRHKLIRIIPTSNDCLTFLRQLRSASASLEVRSLRWWWSPPKNTLNTFAIVLYNISSLIWNSVLFIQLDFWSYPTGLERPVDIHVDPNYLPELSNVLQYQNITYRVLINDLQRLLQKEYYPSSNATTASQDFDSEYHPYPEVLTNNHLTRWFFEGYFNVIFAVYFSCIFLSQILDEMRRLVYTTNHAKLVSIATSYEFRRIYGIEVRSMRSLASTKVFDISMLFSSYLFQIFENESISRPLIFINCGLHAREWLSPATCMYLVRKVTYNLFGLPLKNFIRDYLNDCFFSVFTSCSKIRMLHHYGWTIPGSLFLYWTLMDINIRL